MNIGPFQRLRRCEGIPGYWLGEMTVAGVNFHVECVELISEEAMIPVNPSLDKYFAGLSTFDDADDYQTLSIKGKPHLVVVFPFGQ
jgi:hypothetical protein